MFVDRCWQPMKKQKKRTALLERTGFERMADEGDKLAALLAKRKAARAAKSTADDAVYSGPSTPATNSRQNSYNGPPRPPRRHPPAARSLQLLQRRPCRVPRRSWPRHCACSARRRCSSALAAAVPARPPPPAGPRAPAVPLLRGVCSGSPRARVCRRRRL